MRPQKIIATVSIAALSAVLLAAALASLGAARRGGAAASDTERIRALSHELLKVEPLIHRLEEMQDIILAVRATSPTLERLDKLAIKAESVRKMEDLLARMEKVEPVLESLEKMQKKLAKQKMSAAGVKRIKTPTLADFLTDLQTRLERVEKRLYAPPALRGPLSAEKPLELKIRALEKRQESLAAELEAIRKDLRRLRREQRERPF